MIDLVVDLGIYRQGAVAATSALVRAQAILGLPSRPSRGDVSASEIGPFKKNIGKLNSLTVR